MTADESGAQGAQDARGLGALTHQSDPDVRSVCVVIEPLIGREVSWRGMAFVGGEVVGQNFQQSRAGAMTHTLRAVEEALYA